MSSGVLQTEVYRDLQLLYIGFSNRLQKAVAKCHESGYMVEPFECWRSPKRQDFLYEQGRSRPGRIITNSKAWRSWHQYSCATDFAFKKDGKWSWDGDFRGAGAVFVREGLEWSGDFEQCHVQFTGGLNIVAAEAMMHEYGLPRVWMEIEFAAKKLGK